MVAPRREPEGKDRGIVVESAGDPFARRLLITVGLVALVAVLLIVAWYTAWVWLVLFAGVLLAVFLRALTIGVRKTTHLPNGWSLTVALVLLVVVTVAGFWILSPRVTVQISELRQTLPDAIEAMAESAQQFVWGDFLFGQLENVDLDEFRPMLAAGAATVVQNVFTAAVAVVVVLFLGVYLAAQPGLYIEGTARLFTKAARPRVREVLHKTGKMLMWWLLGRILAMAFVGVSIALGLWALGIPLSFTLGLIAGVLDFVPNVGPIIAAVPAVLLAFAESPTLALWVIVLYFVVQQLESYVVTPIVQQHVVKLPPALTVFAQVLFFVMAGVLGLLLATPIATAGIVIVRELYVKDVLGDEDEDGEEERKVMRPSVERVLARSRSEAHARHAD